MIETVTDLSAAKLAEFDAIIDARSPAEFADDRLPGAINLPVLDDAERARIGTIYKQVSPFDARKQGAALVARNIAGHLQAALADKPGGFRPLVYCWRGGMRSGAMATIFSEIGWRAAVVKGGYRRWRREVVAALRDEDAPLFPMLLVDGQTGTAKTAIIERLAARGAQAIDLEGLAAHRGSVFGGLAGAPQPPQKLFESRLWDALRRFDPARRVIAEAESSMIGDLHVPRRLWLSMQAAPRAEIAAPLEARAGYLAEAYADLAADAEALKAAIARLSPFQPRARIAEWLEMAGSGAFTALAEGLMEAHYDPLYNRARERRDGETAETIALDDLSEGELDRAAGRIAELADDVR